MSSSKRKNTTPKVLKPKRNIFDPFSPNYLAGMTDPPITNSQQTSNRLNFTSLLAADLIETAKDFHVHVDLPGVAPEDLQVTVDNGVLEMAAERKPIHMESSMWANKIERPYGRVSRRLMLPAQADTGSADCTFRNGVLTVSFKRFEGTSPRQLLIK